MIRSSALLIMTVASLLGQSFEVASVKPNESGSGSSSTHTGHGNLTATNVSVLMLMESAFGVKDFQIEGGPGWIGTQRYDIVAKSNSPRDLSEEELRPLLQSLLADRFQLKFHRETKEFQVYSLVVAKGGPKLKEHIAETGGASTNISSGSGKASMTSTKSTIARLADNLGHQLGRVVIDNTGLKGEFDYKMEWSPDQTGESSGPTIFTALQEQLGLKLESAKGPVGMIVIDSAEKAAEN